MIAEDKVIYSFSNRFANVQLGMYLSYKEQNVMPDGFDDYYTLKNEPLENMKLIDDVTLYTYKDTLYRKYNLEKEYYTDYLKDAYGDYIYRDEDDYKDYYAYRSRSIIEDNITNNLLNKEKPIVIEKGKLTTPNQIDDTIKPLNNYKTIKTNNNKNKVNTNNTTNTLIYHSCGNNNSIFVETVSKKKLI